MKTDVTFGEWLKRRRRMLDLTQQELAHEVGCAGATIRKFEAGERRPSKQLATRLAECLDIAPEEHPSFIAFARSEPYIDPAQPAPADPSDPLPWHRPIQRASTVTLPPFIKQYTKSEIDSTIFVARAQELSRLEAALTAVKAGQGQMLFVIGGAGCGKTTLLQEFARRAQSGDTDFIVASGYCNAHSGVGDSYLPFREILTLLTGDVEARWAAGAISQNQALRLWTFMPLSIEALVNYGPDLVNIFVPGLALIHRADAAALGDEWLSRLNQLVARQEARRNLSNLQQHDLFEQYTTLLQVLARHRPMMLVLDDLQWADTGSINLLFHLGRRLEGHRILIVGIYRQTDVALGRDGRRHPLEQVVNELQSTFGNIHIDLNQSEGRSFIKALLDSEPNQLDTAFQEALYNHSRGHALFTIEMLRGMQEQGDLVQDEHGRWREGDTLSWETLPARVEGVIAERIGRLPMPLQEIMKVASVEGEFFTAEVVARVQKIDEPEVIRQLSGVLDKQHRLVSSQSSQVLEPSGQRLSHYRFRHILFQKYLYSSLDEIERVYLHEAIGNVLEQLYESRSEEVAVQLAWHFQLAKSVVKSIGYLRQAGDRAMQSYAYQDAFTFYTKALTLLESLPETPERAEQELTLQISLINTVVVTKGYTADEVAQAFTRAQELIQQAGDTPQLAPILFTMSRFNFMGGHHHTAYQLAEQLLRLAHRIEDSEIRLLAHFMMSVIQLYTAEFISAKKHREYLSKYYDPQQHQDSILIVGFDLKTVFQDHEAVSLWLLGYPAQAMKTIQTSLAQAKKLYHPLNLVHALTYACTIHHFFRDAQAAYEAAEASLDLCIEHGVPTWRAYATVIRGWALAELGEMEEAVEQVIKGLAILQNLGVEAWQTYFWGLLAQVQWKAGQMEEALTSVDKGIAQAEITGERFGEPELYRLKGELLLQVEAEVEERVDKYFRQAIEIAHEQSAMSLELRATMSLSRLLQEQGRQEEAHQMLAKIYNWFSEGFDTIDLKEAKTLLEELS